MDSINTESVVTAIEIADMLLDNGIKIVDTDTIGYWVKNNRFPKPLAYGKKSNSHSQYLYDRAKVETWIKCYSEVFGQSKGNQKRSKFKMEEVYRRYMEAWANNHSVSTECDEPKVDTDTDTDKDARSGSIIVEAVKEADTQIKEEGAKVPPVERPADQSPVNEMHVVHTQFTNSEVKYLTELNEEINNILDYIQNFVAIKIPDINIITDSDSAIKFHKAVFVMANVIQFILKTLKVATNKIEEHDVKINNIIDNFMKRITEK